MINEETLKGFFPQEENIPAKFIFDRPVRQRVILIDGQLVGWEGDMATVISPVQIRKDGALSSVEVGSYPLATEREATLALDAAVRAYDNGLGEWPTMGTSGRIRHMETFTSMMIEKKTEIVKFIVWEIGKTFSDSSKEFDRTIDYIKATIASLKGSENNASTFELAEGVAGQIRRSPLGVVLCMGPFNYPLNETFTILIPALIMGNTVLFKPPKHGTLLFFPLLEAFQKAFPRGVVNTLYGRGANVVPKLMSSGHISVLGLIGSSKVADQLIREHPKTNRLRPVLSLDAKNLAIVLPDAPLLQAARECTLGALSFNGQRCTAIKIIMVHRSIASKFLEELTSEVQKLKIGMPWEDGVSITPLPEPGKPAYLKECISEALEYGANVVNEGGGTMAGSLVVPAIVFPVDERMKLYREEQFGPVIPVLPYDDPKEVTDYLIKANHGQQVSVFGTEPKALGKLVDQLVNLVCRVNINSQCQRGPDVFPFTGRKDSADGTLSVSDALRCFSIRSMVASKLNNENERILESITRNNESTFLNTNYIF